MKGDEQRIEIEQVSSRPRKPDLSRNRSLYFLLLAKGRQRAAVKPELREFYRRALKSLEIKKVDDFWEIKVETTTGSHVENILRADFQFYSTGLNGESDQVVRSNSERAELFWEDFETKISPNKTVKIRTNLEKFSDLQIIPRLSGTQLLQSLILISMFLPNQPREIIFGCLGVAPIARFFWHVKQERIGLLLICLLMALLVANVDLSGTASISGAPVLIITLVASLIWSSFYKLQVTKPSAIFEKSALVICSFVTAAIALKEGVSVVFLSSLACTAVISTLLMRLRATRMMSSSITLSTYGIEILFGLTLGGLLMSQTDALFTNGTILFILFASAGFTIWILNLFIFEKHSITFRFFYPFIFLLEASQGRPTRVLFLLSISVILVTTFCSRSFSKKKI